MLSPLIPSPEEHGSDPLIPVRAAELPQEDDPETIPYKISFAKYNAKECQIDGMNDIHTKETLKTLRDIGIYFTSESAYGEHSQLYSEIKYINNDGGEYGRLFKGLGDYDAEVKEIKIVESGKELDMRIFFYALEKVRTFYLIAVRQTHYDTTKGNFRGKTKKRNKSFRDRRY